MDPITPTSSVAHLDTAVGALTAAHPGAACRIERGARLVTMGAVSPVYGIGFLVASESEPGRSYWVQHVQGIPTCDCEDARHRGNPCKHGWAAVLFVACERLDAEQGDPANVTPFPERAYSDADRFLLTPKGYAALGDPDPDPGPIAGPPLGAAWGECCYCGNPCWLAPNGAGECCIG